MAVPVTKVALAQLFVAVFEWSVENTQLVGSMVFEPLEEQHSIHMLTLRNYGLLVEVDWG